MDKCKFDAHGPSYEMITYQSPQSGGKIEQKNAEKKMTAAHESIDFADIFVKYFVSFGNFHSVQIQL